MFRREIKLELVARTQSDPTLRQALEAVMIRENKPLLNTKEEWSNQPRKRKEKRATKDNKISKEMRTDVITSEGFDVKKPMHRIESFVFVIL